MKSQSSSPPDTLNERLGVLNRREAEARILQAFLKRLEGEFGAERVREILRETIITIAQEQGAAMAREQGDDSLPAFADTLPAWQRDGALEIEELERSETAFHFNVTRCRYAELYRALGIPELGALLSCNRDFALIEGFNPEVKLQRNQTIMEGASHCDFRYRRPAPLPEEGG
ncbi:MAG: L-2-amino-thiazoline-4-carboxylic acid hydrolase [Anaerolineaceae bacterium]|nr:L-2-amino-thiazoline-4-carboxylic acid hydrolase [Anaerolineaceae bacterium]